MKIYRVETPNGRGMCLVTGSPICTAYRKCGGQEVERCRFPKNDFKADLLSINPNMVYGFPTLDAFKAWFPTLDARQAMSKLGARIVPYEVEKAELTSLYQCIFNKSKAVPGTPLEIAGV